MSVVIRAVTNCAPRYCNLGPVEGSGHRTFRFHRRQDPNKYLPIDGHRWSLFHRSRGLVWDNVDKCHCYRGFAFHKNLVMFDSGNRDQGGDSCHIGRLHTAPGADRDLHDCDWLDLGNQGRWYSQVGIDCPASHWTLGSVLAGLLGSLGPFVDSLRHTRRYCIAAVWRKHLQS
jgi:hypothetical protein